MPIHWSSFDGFTPPVERRTLTWEGVVAWIARLESQLGAERRFVAARRAESDTQLQDLGGDRTAHDWRSFLPLRRDREEDWSDWLAQLLEDSVTGQLGWSLLGGIERLARECYIRPTVHREVICVDCRADLVIEWRDASYTHIEVKVGDADLVKTLPTAIRVEERYSRSRARRSDVVLLLPSQLDAWAQDCARAPGMHTRVHSLSWFDVAIALRSALPSHEGESIRWRVWAHAFCGAVEQDLLGMRASGRTDDWAAMLGFRDLQMAAALLGLEGSVQCSTQRRS